ncbi:MAG TPA: hypothetical protein VGS20_04885 [Candidatus Acidoferrales bacterium]|nr:hypothetical protein [Candidatus Acidoferrales bacterium]
MNCEEFRSLMLDCLGGELAAEAQESFTRHESSCAACRAELTRWRQVESWLRAGWPAEDPPSLPALAFPRRSTGGIERAWRWFSWASAGLVTASLVALVLLRPTVRWDGSIVSLAFRAAPSSQAIAGEPVNKEQIEGWVQAAVKREVAEQNASRTAGPAPVQAEWNDAEARRVGQLGSRLELLGESQAYLWRQVQEQEVNLRSLWRTTAMPAAERRPGAE